VLFRSLPTGYARGSAVCGGAAGKRTTADFRPPASRSSESFLRLLAMCDVSRSVLAGRDALRRMCRRPHVHRGDGGARPNCLSSSARSQRVLQSSPNDAGDHPAGRRNRGAARDVGLEVVWDRRGHRSSSRASDAPNSADHRPASTAGRAPQTVRSVLPPTDRFARRTAAKRCPDHSNSHREMGQPSSPTSGTKRTGPRSSVVSLPSSCFVTSSSR